MRRSGCMEMTDLRPFIERVRNTVEVHRVDTASREYANSLSQLHDNSRYEDVYGTADAAIITYTLNEMSAEPQERRLWIDALQKHQAAETGVFAGKGHNEIHSTAFALSALELFDAKGLYPLKWFERYMDEEELIRLLESLDWRNEPWGESLKGAGIYACLVLSSSVGEEWERAYFDWLSRNADPLTGLWRRGCVRQEDGSLIGAPIFHHIAGSFHYLFNLAHRKEPIPYAERMLDTCLELYQSDKLELPSTPFSYFYIDWVYTLLCGMRQHPAYRQAECEAAIKGSTEAFISELARLGAETAEPFDDLHSLCGVVCGLAAIQHALPELIQTDKPLQLVLDRRPFL
jgi:hypothetical protein